MIPDIDHISMGFRNVCKMREGANLPKMMPSETLVAHTMIAVPTTSLFLFQMAMLEASVRFVWEI
jgi:hypothetical protein